MAGETGPAMVGPLGTVRQTGMLAGLAAVFASTVGTVRAGLAARGPVLTWCLAQDINGPPGDTMTQ
jgi:hypothetical protein